MSGAASFVLGLLGLGASAGINASQSIKQKKAVHALHHRQYRYIVP